MGEEVPGESLSEDMGIANSQDAEEQYKQSKRELDEVVSQMESLVSWTCVLADGSKCMCMGTPCVQSRLLPGASWAVARA